MTITLNPADILFTITSWPINNIDDVYFCVADDTVVDKNGSVINPVEIADTTDLARGMIILKAVVICNGKETIKKIFY